MGIFTAKGPLSKIMPEYGLIGTNGETYDSVLGEWDIEWYVSPLGTALKLLIEGIGEDRGYIVVNDIYYKRVYLPPPPHLREYEG